EKYREALTIQPDLADAHTNLSGALMALNRCEEAIAACDKAIALQPADAGAFFHKGESLAAIGRLDEACRCYEAAIHLAPRIPRFHYALAQTKRYRPNDRHLAQMEHLASSMASLSED